MKRAYPERTWGESGWTTVHSTKYVLHRSQNLTNLFNSSLSFISITTSAMFDHAMQRNESAVGCQSCRLRSLYRIFDSSLACVVAGFWAIATLQSFICTVVLGRLLRADVLCVFMWASRCIFYFLSSVLRSD